jgi:hypothetical protein
MNKKKHSNENEEVFSDILSSVSPRGARLRRKASVGGALSGGLKKHRAVRGRRKNRAAGGMHLRGDKRTDK